MITDVTILNSKKTTRRRALILCIVLLLLALGCTAFLIFRPNSEHLTAFLYQDGELLETIDLSAVQTPYSFTVISADGGSNTIEVRPNAIGITAADCPDHLCVSMGFVRSGLLPLVCLPHGLVIELKGNDFTTDAISY